MTASIRHLLLTLGAATLLFLGLAAPPTDATPDARASPADWPTGLLPAVAEALGREAPWRPEATAQGAQAANPRHGLAARFDAQGLHLATDAGEIRLALAGFGRDGELQAPGAAEAEVDGARVVYRHGPHLTQWFLNSPLGLEQGFTLEQRPEGRGELRFALALGGDLQARLEQNELVFEDETGAAQLHYGALVAYDAQGQALPARMHLANARLVLAVDDADATYPVVVDPLFAQVSKLTGDDGVGTRSWFGSSVALSRDGATVLVGAPEEYLPGKRGAAYVFTRDGASWSRQARLTASDGMASYRFGSSVALSEDGTTALVGAGNADHGGKVDAGAAYVFTRNDAIWSQDTKLTASDAAADDHFGNSVALSGDTALVGARGAGFDDGGAAYVFTRDDITWTEQAILTANDSAQLDYFGDSVALSGDTALVGAPQARHDGKNKAGAAYVFSRNGATWSQQTKLTASDAAANDHFGDSVALSEDGATALVGAHQRGPDLSQVGVAYVFTRDGASWSQHDKLIADDGESGDGFGYSVALSGDGATALIGAYSAGPDGKSRAGAAYLFTRGASWSQQAKLTASDAAANDYFGVSVALPGDGAIAVVGAYWAAGHGGKSEMGAAYLFGPAVDLQLVKRATLGEAPQGATFTYSLHVTNNDTEADATGVTLIDPLPAGVSHVADDGDCAVSGATVTCALGTLAKGGGTASVQITVRAEAAPGTLITNTASVAADQPDANLEDNTDSVDTEVANTAPVADDLAFTVEPGAVYSGTLPAADANGDALTFAIVTDSENGTVEITDAATGAFTYTPNAGASGTDSFTFRVSDGLADSNTATVNVIINTAPVADDLAFTTRHGIPYSGTLTAADADGDALTFAIVENGTLGTAVITDAATGAFTYTPNAGESGTDSFTFQVHDGTEASDVATVTVTIHNAAPAADGLAFTVDFGAVYSGILTAADADGDALTFTIVTNGTQGSAVITNPATGAFTYTPHAGASGTDSFTFRVSDGAFESNTATVTVTIQPAPNPAPGGDGGDGGDSGDSGNRSGGGGGGALSPLALLLGLAAMARRRAARARDDVRGDRA